MTDTTGDSPSVALLPYLDKTGVDAALRFILGNWPNAAPMRGEEREAWLDVLCQFRQGELRAALLNRKDNKSHRPEPYAVLDIVLETRRAAEQSKRWQQAEANANRMRALAAEEPPPVGAHAAMRRVMEANTGLVESYRRRTQERKPKLNGPAEPQEAAS